MGFSRAVFGLNKEFGISDKLDEKDKRIILTSPSGIKFVLTEYEKLDIEESRKKNSLVNKRQIVLSTGIVQTSEDEYFDLIPAPQATEEVFRTTVGDFANTLAAIANHLYMIDVRYVGGRNPLPNETITIGPQLQRIGRKDIKGDFDIKSVEDLKDRISIEKPNIKFDEVGGQEEAKREMLKLVAAIKSPSLHKRWGTRPPKGLMLYGPPGTGKTLMAKALASEADATFFHVQIPDISSKYYGQSEQLMQGVFDIARDNEGPTIIFFDEIDAIAPHREGAHEATQRIVGTLLINMDGLESSENVFVVASTNRLSSVDPALIRPGRFDRKIEVSLPTPKDLKEIFAIHMKKAESLAERTLFQEIDLDNIGGLTENLSGADVAEIIRRVLEEKVRAESAGENPDLVTTQEIIREVSNFRRLK